MKNNSLMILFITVMFGFMSYNFFNNSTLSLLILFTGAIFFYISKKNNHDRKENLNIIRDENRLYFYLSDDLLFSVELPQNKSLTETLRTVVNKEILTFKNMTRQICFINFKEDTLLQELNERLFSGKKI